MRTRLVLAALAAVTAMPLATRAQTVTATATPHGKFTAPCAQCHRPDAWRPVRISAEFKHAPDRFPLEGAHLRVTCATCHKKLDFTGVTTTCASCHRDAHQGEFGSTCTRCHSQRSFLDVAPMRQMHQLTAFPLSGGHAAVDCRSCHTPRAPGQQAYMNRSTNCASCHLPDYQQARNPPHAAAGFPQDCAACHTATRWLGAPFDHAKTQFPLTGAHRAATCTSCHRDGVYRGKPTTCVSCHQATYTQTKNPPHAAAGFPTTCQTCHTTTAWPGAVFDHATTRFPLAGAHRAVNCAGCHADGVYRGKPTTCVSCHQTKYNQTTNPPHVAAGFPNTCESCHTPTAWTPAPFNHSATQFPLTGAHVSTACARCHGDGVYRGKPTTCVSCHQTKYTQTTNPPHAAAGFPTTCQTCHTTTAWPGAVFDHAATRFPLAGAHRAVNCAGCHADGVYRGKPTTCVSCHQTKYNQTTNPPHVAAGFPNTCESCHTPTAWTPAPFNHSATQFPLTGAHASTACARCHGDGVYRGKPTTCVSCHQTKYTQTTNPPHAAAGFPTTCQTCHTTTQWPGAVFDHAATVFPLAGAHRAVNCAGCHADGVYRGKPTTCVSCHQTKYNQTTNPPHVAAGFPNTCESCHTPTAWTPAPFNHSATQFPLTGAHVSTACARCHGDGVYRGKPTTCVSCHQARYNATTNPNHIAARFPTDCASCHTTTQWLGARFDHDASYFPIYSGAHAGRWSTCASCHTTPTNFAVFDCLSCHTRTETDSHHRGRTGYVYASPSCYACHPRGKAG